MNYNEALRFIHGRKKLPSKGSPERMEVLLDRVGHPERQLSFVHITGTNGKGSAAAMMSAILMESGKTVGLFTSPYVCHYRERFQVGGQEISENELAKLVEKIQIVIEQMEAEGHFVTEFELGTVLAFQYFLERRCDIVVLEVGIGGSHDATNVIPPPLVSLMMKVGLDHTAMLGSSLEEIAREKAGIIKGNPAVSYPCQPAEVLAVFMEQCAHTGSQLILPAAGSVEILDSGLWGTTFRYGEEEYTVPLAGEHQAYNAAAVIEVAKRLGIDSQTICKGLSKACLPARMEVLRQEPLIMLDGGHNLDAVEALCRNIKQWNMSHLTAVVGMMGDKDCAQMLRLIAGITESIRTVDIDYPRAAPADELAEQAKAYCPDAAALGNALQAAQWVLAQQTPILICGSFYLAGEMREYLKV